VTPEEKAEKIRKVGELLEKAPCTGWYAKNSQGKSVDECSSEACCWCVKGAFRKVCDYDLWAIGAVVRAAEVYLDVDNIQVAWEGQGTTDESRLELARKLQKYV